MNNSIPRAAPLKGGLSHGRLAGDERATAFLHRGKLERSENRERGDERRNRYAVGCDGVQHLPGGRDPRFHKLVMDSDRCREEDQHYER
jgi:hypothetical protein